MFDPTTGSELSPDTDWAAGIVPGTTQNLDPSLSPGSGIASGSGTGQAGVSTMGDTDREGINGIWDWLHEPFRTPLDTIDIVLLVGIVVLAIWLWGLVLYHVRIAAETI